MQVDPSVTDWITAFSTVGALIAATVAGIAAWRAFGIESRASQQRDEDRRASQAAHVAAWIGEAPRETADARVSLASRPTYTACYVLNSSPLPVFDVLYVFVVLGAEGKSKTVGTDAAVVIPPGEDRRAVPPRIDETWFRLGQDEYPTLAVELRFTDAAGRRWWRAWNGILTDKGMRERGAAEEPEAD